MVVNRCKLVERTFEASFQSLPCDHITSAALRDVIARGLASAVFSDTCPDIEFIVCGITFKSNAPSGMYRTVKLKIQLEFEIYKHFWTTCNSSNFIKFSPQLFSYIELGSNRLL